jgi:hypothetical protein
MPAVENNVKVSLNEVLKIIFGNKLCLGHGNELALRQLEQRS